MTAMPERDLFDPSILEDPYPTYARMRAEQSAYWQPTPSFTGGMWMFTRYPDVEFVLKDLRFTKDARKLYDIPDGPLPPNMLDLDPPDHTRLRGLVSQAFTPRVIEQLEGHIRSIADHLLDRVQDDRKADLLQDFALPLPVIVIAQLLGVPQEDHDTFRGWSGDFIDGIDFLTSTEESRARAQAALPNLAQYLGELIARRRAQPRDDLISHLITAEDEGGKLRQGELLSNCILLLIAGHETTVNLIGNGTLALLQHPDQLQLLRERPEFLPGAIEEMLRFDAPVQRALFRAALEDVQVGTHIVKRGEQVSAVIGAANRDPSVFENADRFDVTRNPNRHLSFGRGIHFCLGAPLAKLEARVAFEQLLHRMPELSLQGFERRPSSMFRGLRSLNVTF